MSFSRRALLVGLSSTVAACTTLNKFPAPAPTPAPIPVTPYPWFPCDGRLLKRAAYPELYNALFGDTPWRETDEEFRLPHILDVDGYPDKDFYYAITTGKGQPVEPLRKINRTIAGLRA